MDRIGRIIRESIDRLIKEDEKIDASSLEGMIFVAHGEPSYDPSKFNTAEVNWWTLVSNKPKGGLWASPLYSNWGWSEWCATERTRLESLTQHFMFRLAPGARIYVIDSLDDIKRMMRKSENDVQQYPIDFLRLMREGYDGVFATEKAVVSVPGLDAWDCESICIFNKDVIVPVSPDMFEDAVANNYKDTLSHEDRYYDEDDPWGDRGDPFDPMSKEDRKQMQMDRDYELYGNRNLEPDMSRFFNGQHPSMMAQSGDERGRVFDGTAISGMRDKRHHD